MKTTLKAAGIFLPLLISCNQSDPPTTVGKNHVYSLESTYASLQTYYRIQMNKKNFSLEMTGDCDDALSDTLYKDHFAIIENQILTDSSALVEFKFKSTCCIHYLGDYTITNDTLLFEYEDVGEEACSCICWYEYKLDIRDIQEKFSAIKIEPRNKAFIHY